MSYPEYTINCTDLCPHCKGGYLPEKDWSTCPTCDAAGLITTAVPLDYALKKLGYRRPDPLGLGIDWERMGERVVEGLTAKLPPPNVADVPTKNPHE